MNNGTIVNQESLNSIQEIFFFQVPKVITMEIKKIGVIGAGTMGHGIALVSLLSGHEVIMMDIDERFVAGGIKAITGTLEKFVAKGKVTAEDKDTYLGNLQTAVNDFTGFADCDIVVEAVIENIGIKKKVFGALDGICKPETILASNTSTIPITAMAAATSRPGKFIGMHFMNPVRVMKLVEVINGLGTDPETTDVVMKLSEKMGKVPIQVNDSPGFVSNRVLLPMINEAIYCLYEGVGTKESIDGVMKLGMNHPLGPLALADLIGLDTCLYILQVLHEGFSDSKYRPCPLLKKMVHAGYLGKKVGKGFYDYS